MMRRTDTATASASCVRVNRDCFPLLAYYLGAQVDGEKRSICMVTISAEGFDRHFDKGGDITPYLDKSSKRRSNQQRPARHISMDVPEEMVCKLDHAAESMGVNRQDVIKAWLTERLDTEKERAARGSAV